MSDEIIVLPSDAPAPLEIYEKEKIHPDNRALLEHRFERFRRLMKKERKSFERQRNQLWKQLNKSGYNQLVKERYQTHLEFVTVRDNYYQVQAGARAVAVASLRWLGPEQRAVLFAALLRVSALALSQLRAEGRALRARGVALNEKIGALAPVHEDYREAVRRLELDDLIIEDDRQRRQEERGLHEEGKIVEQLILDTFARTRGCHYSYTDRRGRTRTETPRFSRAGVDADSHWFLLAANEKTRFGWRSILPYMVDVQDLVSERTLMNISAAVGRQVEVRRSEDGTQIYFRVNRLDSPDGLPKYFVFRSMFELYPKDAHELVPFPVGVFQNRRVKWYNLKSDPHILIAGKTRAGKSNYINTIVSTVIQTHSPAELRLALIDNKGGVEFSHYKGIPHLLGDVVKTPREVMPKLREVRQIMNERLALLEAAGKKDIFSYNASVPVQDRLPQIIVLIDEMQTLLNKGKWTRNVHHQLAVLGSQGAAPGIHLILCTQHPSKEVVPMPVKTNMSCFIAFRMSAHASQTILSEPLAAELPRRVPGRCVVASGIEMEQAQTPFISDEEVADAVQYSIKQFSAVAALPGGVPAPAVEDDDTSEVEPLKPFEVARVMPVVFEESDLIAMALDQFEGALKAVPIFNALKGQGNVTRSQVLEMVRKLSEREYIEYQGATFRAIKQRGNFYRLFEVDPDITAAPTGENVDFHEETAGDIAGVAPVEAAVI